MHVGEGDVKAVANGRLASRNYQLAISSGPASSLAHGPSKTRANFSYSMATLHCAVRIELRTATCRPYRDSNSQGTSAQRLKLRGCYETLSPLGCSAKFPA